MTTQDMQDLGIRTYLDIPYDEAVEKVTAALKAEGFGVLTEIDVKATMKKKLDVDFRRYVILGACNPPLAHKALSTEAEIGLLLPCNAIVYEDEDGGRVMVSIVNPLMMLSMGGINPSLQEVANEATVRLTRVVESLNG